ncbi:Crp/Fnr family transcriptional regulator [Aurantiacibacter luteus]|uniref:Crp/Fnr family transcriptional regulator n=1 Tax=Aurantiacibacter luteus TaxID=1581420 RepID=UPI00069AD99B|nr:Crp/Fnr family transcriptional regulator [Aurantiacibacter luteus]
MAIAPGEEINDERGRKVISRLAGFVDLDPSEVQQLVALAGREYRFERGDIIRSENEHDLYLLIDGWAASAVIVEDGSRQLITANLPGDILGLPGLAVRDPVDTVIALTDVEVIGISPRQIGEAFAHSPRLAALMFLISQEERSLLMERLALMGQASALTRLSALILRMQERHAQIDRNTDASFFMPLTQRELGELIGVTGVHMNALLKELRERGIAVIKARKLTILDRDELIRIAGVSPWCRSSPSWLPCPEPPVEVR